MAAVSAAWANIPPKQNRKDPICVSPYPYRTRNLIERFLNKARRRMCPLYISGPIGPGDRKSVQPMATRPAPGNYDQLHHFIADGVWDAAPLESSYRWSCCCACRSRRNDVRHRRHSGMRAVAETFLRRQQSVKQKTPAPPRFRRGLFNRRANMQQIRRTEFM
jgi:hypothetical protein